MALINCPECNKKISDTVKACPHCGYSLKGIKKNNVKNNMNYHNKSVKTGIILVVTIVVIVIFGINILNYFNNPSRKFIENLKNNDINNAKVVYNEEIKDDTNLVQNADKELLNNIDLIVDKYIDKSENYDDTIELLNEYKSFTSIKSELSRSIHQVNEINKSNIAYDKGIEYFKNKKNSEALKQFKKVIEADSNYEDALIRITELETVVADEYAIEAKINYNKEQYSNAINYINKAIDLEPNNSEYQQLLETYRKAQEDKNEQKRKDEENKRQEEKEKQKLYTGKIIKNDAVEIEFKNFEFTTKILPPDTSGAYIYYDSAIDEIYLDFVFKVINNGKYDLNYEYILSDIQANYNNGYMYYSYGYFYTRDGDIEQVYSWDNLEPLKTSTIHLALKLPRDIADTDKSLEVSFSVLGQKQKIKIR